MKKTLITGIFIGLFITLGTIAAILYATGYRLEFGGNGTGQFKFIEGTGILVANSQPDGAKILVNDELKSATNDTINLAPGEYDVRLEKDGYVTWNKRIIIRKGLVSEATALLLPVAPRLEAATTIGIQNAVMDDTGSLLAYGVASTSASKNGIYVLNMNSGPLTFLGASGTQIIDESIDDFSEAKMTFSPDGQEILAELSNPTRYYLIESDGRPGQNPQDVTLSLEVVEEDWQLQREAQLEELLNSFSRELKPVAELHFSDMNLSPESDRILYTASTSANLPIVLKNEVPSLNSTPETRELIAGNVYVYDITEDKNFLLFDAQNLEEGQMLPEYHWHASNRNLVYARSGRINIIEFDGQNDTTVYNGPFLNGEIFPWPDGGSIAIVSRLSNSVPYNLYRIGL